MGTLDYVAPEQVRGGIVDGRADVYSLGCLLFEALTGDVPFRRASNVATIYAHLEEPPPAASTMRPSLPAAIDAVLCRAMAKDPGSRHATCGALIDETRAALDLESASPRLSRRRLAVAGLAVAALLAAAVVSTVLLAGGDAAALPAHGSLIRIDPATMKVTAQYPVSAHPGVVTTSSGRVWLGDFRDGSLWQLNPETGDIRRLSSVGEPRDLTSLGGTVWVASDTSNVFTGTVTKYDAVTGSRIGGLDLLACSVGAGLGVVWATGCPFVDRISTDDGPVRILRQLLLPYPHPRTGSDDRMSLHDIAVGEGSVWVTGDMVDRRIWRLDPKTGAIQATIQLLNAPRTIAAGAGGVWVTAPLDDLVLRIDPATNRVVDRIEVGRGASGVSVGEGAVWVTSSLDATVSRIDPRNRRVTATVRVGGLLRDIAVGAGGVWVTADAR
jgi:DNA-binding beta-propeller fold protein YncE